MGNVIQFRKTSVKQDVVDYFERMLARARCGRVQGSWAVNDMDSGEQTSSSCGSFKVDTAFAAMIVSQGLDSLRSRVANKRRHNAVLDNDTLPAMLRSS